MKKQNIAVALVCVVLFTCARGAIAQTMEEKIARFPDEWFLPDSYFPDGYQRGDTIPFFSPNDPYLDYGNQPIAASDEEQIGSIAREWYLGPDYFPYWYRMGAPIPWFSRNDSYFYLPELLPLWYQVRWFSPNDTDFGYDNLGSEPINSGVGVPEPCGLVLLGTGCLGVLLMVWGRKRAAICDMLKHNLPGYLGG